MAPKRPRTPEVGIEPIKLQRLDNDSNIRFKVFASSLDEPNFYTSCYCVKPTTTENLLTIKDDDLHKFFKAYNGQFYICNLHHLSEKGVPNCEYCTPFLEFKYAFIVHTQYAFHTFPPPALFVPMNINYFKTFLHHSTSTTSLQSNIAKDKYREKDFLYYSAFMNMNFQGGKLRDIATGKRSFVRNKILGFQSKGIRATLTIDASLGPHYATLPQKIFDSLNLATPLMIVNRAPSIKNTCIYVVEVGRNKIEDDYTIHINAFLTEGLHADQDGDELSIFFLEHQGEKPSIEMQMAIVELKRLSWKYGNRHCLNFKSRYQFTQYHKYILHKFDKYFTQHDPLWANLEGTPKEKAYKIMELGCSTHFVELDNFIDLLLTFTQNLPPLLTPTADILNGVGDILTVVDSGSKGSKEHIQEYLKNLFHDNPDNLKNLIDGFNKNIINSSLLGKEGGRQFSLLHAVNPLSLHNSAIYYNEKILLDNVKYSSSMSTYNYNVTGTREILKGIITANTDLTMSAEDYHNILSDYM